jgi:hypothetical protein
LGSGLSENKMEMVLGNDSGFATTEFGSKLYSSGIAWPYTNRDFGKTIPWMMKIKNKNKNIIDNDLV